MNELPRDGLPVGLHQNLVSLAAPGRGTPDKKCLYLPTCLSHPGGLMPGDILSKEELYFIYVSSTNFASNC